jgi:hypothetical protein
VIEQVLELRVPQDRIQLGHQVATVAELTSRYWSLAIK